MLSTTRITNVPFIISVPQHVCCLFSASSDCVAHWRIFFFHDRLDRYLLSSVFTYLRGLKDSDKRLKGKKNEPSGKTQRDQMFPSTPSCVPFVWDRDHFPLLRALRFEFSWTNSIFHFLFLFFLILTEEEDVSGWFRCWSPSATSFRIKRVCPLYF